MKSEGLKGSRTSFHGAETGGLFDKAVEEGQAMARLLKLSVVTRNLVAEGVDVFRVEAEILQGVGDCLIQSAVILSSMLGGRRTIDVGWTDANQMAISS